MWLGHVVPGSFRRGPRPAAPVGPAAGGAVQHCAEHLLPVPRLRPVARSPPSGPAQPATPGRAYPSRPMVVPN
jgi:hypothetical protein